MKNVVGRFEEVNHHADVSTSEAEVNSRVRRLRAELDQVNDIDERDDLLSNQLANLDMNVRRAYVKALALEAFDQAQDLSLFLMQLSVATTGTRFHAELDVAVQELNELLEALSTTGDPDEVYMQVDGSTKREPGGP